MVWMRRELYEHLKQVNTTAYASSRPMTYTITSQNEVDCKMRSPVSARVSLLKQQGSSYSQMKNGISNPPFRCARCSRIYLTRFEPHVKSQSPAPSRCPSYPTNTPVNGYRKITLLRAI